MRRPRAGTAGGGIEEQGAAPSWKPGTTIPPPHRRLPGLRARWPLCGETLSIRSELR